MRDGKQDAVKFAECMRSHAVPDFPDPNSSGEIPKDKVVPLVGTAQFQVAQSACQHVAPGGGAPSQSPAHGQRQVAALLAFARCIRSHGFPNFPDPTGGELTHEMVANARINLHQPAVLEAGDACVSVTRGVITKAIVARFVAGH